MDIYDRIKQRRIELGLTQTELAEKAGYKGKDMISRIESKKITLTQPRIVKLAAALQTSEGWLMGWEDDPDQYYLEKDAKELAEFMLHNPEYKVLFQASQKVKKEDIQLVAELLERFKQDD